MVAETRLDRLRQITAIGPASLVLTARLRAAGSMPGLASCDGRLPSLELRGSVRIGRGLAVRGRLAPVEIGAGRDGVLTVGDRAFLNQGSSVVAVRRIAIGDDFRLGDFAAVYDSDHHPLEEGRPTRCLPVSIGDNVWVARGAVILPGCTIGSHAVIATGSIVTTDVEDRVVVAGNPARPVRSLTASELWRRG